MGQLKIRAQFVDEVYEAIKPQTKYRKRSEEVAQSKTQTSYEFGTDAWLRVNTRGAYVKTDRIAPPAGGQTLTGALELLLASGTPFRMSSPGVEMTGKAQGKVSKEFGITLYGNRVVRLHAPDGASLAIAVAFGVEDAKVPALTRAGAASGESDPDNQEGVDPTAPDAV